MQFEVKWIEKFLADPVMAAEVIIGAKLDDFQRARLRMLWFTPYKVDSSGWSTGKTICEWIYGNLRCVLLPDHVCGVYYPVFSTGQDEFWMKYFNMFKDRDLLRSQFKDGKAEHKAPGCWRMEYRNGSLMQLPAPGFLNDAENQASRRFNTLIVGEYTMAARKGEGVDELLGRVSAPSYNKNHPVWGNHILLSAHAESPSHPSYKYVRAAKQSIAGKNTAAEQHQNALISFCYLDWSSKPVDPARPQGKTFQVFREDNAINRSKRTLSRDEFRRRILGLAVSDGRGWYSENLLKRRLKVTLNPETRRAPAHPGTEVIYTLGADFAPGQSGKADECSFVVWKGVQYLDLKLTEDLPAPTLEYNGTSWHVSPVYAHSFKNVDTGQISGFIHYLHLCFAFSLMSLDKGGGGDWVYKELMKSRQLIQNEWMDVTPLCTREELNQTDKQPLIVFFKRGGQMNALWLANFLQSDEGVIEAAHRRYRESWEGGEHDWPELSENRSRLELAAMTVQERYALSQLTKAYKQLIDVQVKVGGDSKTPILTKKGFYQFLTLGKKKKDAAYASLYGKMAMDLIITNAADQEEEEDALA